ncbi:MAG: methyltransferase [Bacteroidetes bacterium]|nr:MAG: methyltransferase [Bacteroidota bacterium]MBL1145831.1 methyltransferase [Bacteroidota bacterium]MCB0803120.1 methyltransferase [Flavobacteriales bacterium]NOG58625.1 methyltransferase [Bacteroidota bacterium]
MVNDYNAIAPIYTFLSKLVFFGCIQKSQEEFLSLLPVKGKVLFMGGGGGNTLKIITQKYPLLHIDYIDQSEKMISLSRKRLINEPNHHVNFIVGNENNIPDTNYDVIMTFFYLDLFSPKNLDLIHKTLNNTLSVNGLWLISDFNQAKKWWQKAIELMMFSFLKITTGIESNSISAIRESYFEPGFRKKGLTYFYGKYIFAAAYQKV